MDEALEQDNKLIVRTTVEQRVTFEKLGHRRNPRWTCVCKVSGETNTDDLSPAQDAWSRPDIPLHARAMYKMTRDGLEPEEHGSIGPMAQIEAMRRGQKILTQNEPNCREFGGNLGNLGATLTEKWRFFVLPASEARVSKRKAAGENSSRFTVSPAVDFVDFVDFGGLGLYCGLSRPGRWI